VIRDLTQWVEAKRKELVDKLTRGGFATENLRPPQILMMMKLQALSRFAASLPTRVAGGVGGSGTMMPVEAYLQLRELLGELAATNPARDMFDAPKYDHDNPLPIFLELDRKIRALGDDGERTNVIELPLTADGTATVSAAMTEEHLTKPNGYWLCIKTRMEPSVLGKLVEDQDKFKVMPKSMVKLNIFGVKLEEDRHPPMGFKSSTDRHYFRIDVGASQKMWERITGEKAVSVRWSELEPLTYEDIRIVMSLP
jgi:predicted component of type VI protein secretion system